MTSKTSGSLPARPYHEAEQLRLTRSWWVDDGQQAGRPPGPVRGASRSTRAVGQHIADQADDGVAVGTSQVQVGDKAGKLTRGRPSRPGGIHPIPQPATEDDRIQLQGRIHDQVDLTLVQDLRADLVELGVLRILFTNRDWPAADIVAAYRSQSEVGGSPLPPTDPRPSLGAGGLEPPTAKLCRRADSSRRRRAAAACTRHRWRDPAVLARSRAHARRPPAGRGGRGLLASGLWFLLDVAAGPAPHRATAARDQHLERPGCGDTGPPGCRWQRDRPDRRDRPSRAGQSDGRRGHGGGRRARATPAAHPAAPRAPRQSVGARVGAVGIARAGCGLGRAGGLASDHDLPSRPCADGGRLAEARPRAGAQAPAAGGGGGGHCRRHGCGARRACAAGGVARPPGTDPARRRQPDRRWRWHWSPSAPVTASGRPAAPPDAQTDHLRRIEHRPGAAQPHSPIPCRRPAVQDADTDLLRGH